MKLVFHAGGVIGRPSSPNVSSRQRLGTEPSARSLGDISKTLDGIRPFHTIWLTCFQLKEYGGGTIMMLQNVTPGVSMSLQFLQPQTYPQHKAAWDNAEKWYDSWFPSSGEREILELLLDGNGTRYSYYWYRVADGIFERGVVAHSPGQNYKKPHLNDGPRSRCCFNIGSEWVISPTLFPRGLYKGPMSTTRRGDLLDLPTRTLIDGCQDPRSVNPPSPPPADLDF